MLNLVIEKHHKVGKFYVDQYLCYCGQFFFARKPHVLSGKRKSLGARVKLPH